MLAIAELGAHASAPIILTQLLRLSQITGGFVPAVDNIEASIKHQVQFTPNPKIQALRELLEDEIPENEKVVVWCRFVPEIIACAQLVSELGYEPMLLYSGVKEEDRVPLVEYWGDPTNEKARVLIGNPSVGGLGLNMVAARYCVYYSNSYSLEHRLQSEDRLHRIGQTGDKVTYIDLEAKDTIDGLVIDALNAKISVADKVTSVPNHGLL